MANGAAIWLVFFGVTVPAGVGLYLVSLRFAPPGPRSSNAAMHRRQPSSLLFIAAFLWAVGFALFVVGFFDWWWLLVASVVHGAAAWRETRMRSRSRFNRLLGQRTAKPSSRRRLPSSWLAVEAIAWAFFSPCFSYESRRGGCCSSPAWLLPRQLSGKRTRGSAPAIEIPRPVVADSSGALRRRRCRRSRNGASPRHVMEPPTIT